MNYKKNKLAPDQAKIFEGGKHLGERSDRASRRRSMRGQPKRSREYWWEEEYIKLLQDAFYEHRHIPELVFVRLGNVINGNQDVKPNCDYEIVELTMKSYSVPEVAIKVGNKTVVMPKFYFTPSPPTEEEFAIFIMKKEIGLK